MLTVFLWVKVIHVLAVISWMAGLLYLPRLFVYHADQIKGSATSDLFEIMEYRLLKFIMRPAMIVAWASGLWMAYEASYFTSFWFMAKLALVILMTGCHEFLGRELVSIAGGNRRSSKFYRVLNEVPTLLMIGIVIMVIVKPF